MGNTDVDILYIIEIIVVTRYSPFSQILLEKTA
jgi:hypothetical protein